MVLAVLVRIAVAMACGDGYGFLSIWRRLFWLITGLFPPMAWPGAALARLAAIGLSAAMAVLMNLVPPGCVKWHRVTFL